MALLEQADRPLSSTVFVKLAFLLRQETVLKDEHTFYDMEKEALWCHRSRIAAAIADAGGLEVVHL